MLDHGADVYGRYSQYFFIVPRGGPSTILCNEKISVSLLDVMCSVKIKTGKKFVFLVHFGLRRECYWNYKSENIFGLRPFFSNTALQWPW